MPNSASLNKRLDLFNYWIFHYGSYKCCGAESGEREKHISTIHCKGFAVHL